MAISILGFLERLMKISGAAGVLFAAILIALLALLGAADVVAESVFGAPIPAASEFAAAILPTIILLGLAYSLRVRAHISVDVLVNLMPPALQRASSFAGLLMTTVFVAALAYGAVLLAIDSWRLSEFATAVVRFPIYPAKIAFALGAVLGLLEVALQLLRGLSGLFHDAENTPPEETS